MTLRTFIYLAVLIVALPFANAQSTGGRGNTPACTEWENSGPFSGNINAPVANQTKLWSMVFSCNLSATKITYSVSTADASADLYDIGFYTATGTLVCHTGATAGTTFAPSTNARVTLALTGACNFQANTRYLVALTGNAATAVLYGASSQQIALAGTNPTTGNTTAGGALNSSITPPADLWAGGQPPVIALHN